MPVIEVGSTTFGYDEAGTGPAVVLVHAGLADRRMWEHQFEALSKHHRVIRFDWRGYGESSDAAGEIARHEDLLAVMDALKVQEAAVVGCSDGGAHALDVALAAPPRVTALGLICSSMSGHEWPVQTLELMRERMSGAVPADRLQHYRDRTAAGVDPADIAAMAEANVRLMVAGPDRDPAELDPAVWQLALEMCRGVYAREWNGPLWTERHLQPPARGRLAEIGVPTLVINGLADVPGIQEISALLADRITGARRMDLASTGHLPPMERPVEVTGALSDFLARAGN
jgi:pimeloyl-ACP methyl ester carboxylesterase